MATFECWSLTHWGRVMHICFGKLIIIGSDNGLAPNIVNWTLGNKFQWNLNWNLYIFIQENAFDNVVWKMAAILSRPHCVKHVSSYKGLLFITRQADVIAPNCADHKPKYVCFSGFFFFSNLFFYYFKYVFGLADKSKLSIKSCKISLWCFES